ncbi:hypothetical protein Tco_0427924 [Tanacetum coccineum]
MAVTNWSRLLGWHETTNEWPFNNFFVDGYTMVEMERLYSICSQQTKLCCDKYSSDRSDVFTRVQKLDQLIKDVKELCSFGRVQTVGEHFEKYVPYAMPMMPGATQVCAQAYGSIPAPSKIDGDFLPHLADAAAIAVSPSTRSCISRIDNEKDSC